MRKRLDFYIKHSLTDLRVNGQRTFFALLCIAAGVAAIVSLQTLAVMIGSTLTGNLQSSNRGDITYSTGGFMGASSSDEAMADGVERGIIDANTANMIFGEFTEYVVTTDGYDRLAAWFDENYPGQATLTYRQSLTNAIGIVLGTGRGTIITDPATGNSSPQATAILIDPDVYPFYSQITDLNGRPLAELITAPEQIVLSDLVARNLGIEAGATVTINGSDTVFTVTGIVDTAQELKNPARDILTGISGFYYLDNSAIALFDEPEPRISTFYVRLADPLLLPEIEAAFDSEWPYFNSTDTEDLRENYTELSENINQLVTVMGLVSLLIGSIGIVNTMQVIVRRRTLEVGVLKTLGLQANQITLLFMVEAVIMGVIGSLAGVVLGWLATFVIRGAAEQLFATSLPFVLAPAPAITGFIVGVVVTSVFGFLPTLSAGQVRPNIVLRPSDTFVPRAGLLRLIMVIVLIIVSMAFVTQSIVGGFQTALIVIGGTFFIAGIFYVMLWLLIWLIGRFFPTFGIIDLKISLRQMLAGRSRAAMTLLALVVGVFSLSLVTLMAESINNLLRFSLTESSGGNVMIFATNANQATQIETALAGVDGVQSYGVMQSYTVTLTGVQEGDVVLTPEEIGARMTESLGGTVGFFGGRDEDDNDITDQEVNQNNFEWIERTVNTIDARPVDQMPDRTLNTGRQIGASDSGLPVMVIGENDFITAAGIGVGDILIFQLGANGLPNAPTIEFEVVGVTAPNLNGGGFESANYAPIDAFPAGIAPDRVTIVADVLEEQVPALRRALSDIRGAFVIETAVLTQLIEALLGTFIAFPTMVALLGLVVGGVVIANSVALTTMERRREIAIMKSVGLQRERVLLMILLENGILGLIGGLIGVGIGLIGLVIALSGGQVPLTTIPIGTALVLMLICVAVALLAALTSAWGASGEKPLNVLRYE